MYALLRNTSIRNNLCSYSYFVAYIFIFINLFRLGLFNPLEPKGYCMYHLL
jgi:hypothetical protein